MRVFRRHRECERRAMLRAWDRLCESSKRLVFTVNSVGAEDEGCFLRLLCKPRRGEPVLYSANIHRVKDTSGSMLFKARSAAVYGIDAHLIDVEVDFSQI